MFGVVCFLEKSLNILDQTRVRLIEASEKLKTIRTHLAFIYGEFKAVQKLIDSCFEVHKLRAKNPETLPENVVKIKED